MLNQRKDNNALHYILRTLINSRTNNPYTIHQEQELKRKITLCFAFSAVISVTG